MQPRPGTQGAGRALGTASCRRTLSRPSREGREHHPCKPSIPSLRPQADCRPPSLPPAQRSPGPSLPGVTRPPYPFPEHKFPEHTLSFRQKQLPPVRREIVTIS